MKPKNNISYYWKCQLIGWSGAATYWAFLAWVQGPQHFNILLAAIHFLLDIAIGIGVTHAYHAFAYRFGWINLRIQNMPARLIPAVIIMGLLYMMLVILKLYAVRLYFGYSFDETLTWFFIENYPIISATGIRLMAIWLLAFHLYHYAVMEIGTAKDNARLQAIAHEAQLQQLSTQLNPHFFFNSLNSVKALVSINPLKARRAIDLLSDLLRNSLYGNNTGLVPLADEISLVNYYLELEKIRYEDRLQISITLDEHLNDLKIPALSIQTLVENAIKHGIAQQKDGGCVSITVAADHEYFVIRVENPGRLIYANATNGLGLKNLKERLNLQYQGKAKFTMIELPGEKVLSTIKIPLL
ncbi:sensor histidine kinase [Mucilaginibacter flavus]|uniref:sensor histidine kinase n=1 Tax=Mucilaginibacter flavus TaxID=931504 RepID=UPI0025B2F8BA|nr:histidine kinase [Mucilaginibacter flavus]MDN3584459.1 histidine kinase [Mucilaginibacter flavus]